MTRTFAAVMLGGLAAALGAAPVAGSNKITSGATGVALAVADSNTAILSYRARGQSWSVTATGAINARFPSRRVAQTQFRLTYGQGGAGGVGECRRYDGPTLPWVVAACKGKRGDYWVAQSWPRNLPNYGVKPRTTEQGEWDLRLSHWKGPLPVFTVKLDWAYRQFDHLYGSFLYRGRPMFGFGTTTPGNPTDRYGVLIYLDTFNPAYGPGWRRENSFVTHRGSGVFCYGFFPHAPVPSGKGQAYRATVVGPGALPDLMWSAKAPGQYNRDVDAKANAEQARVFSDRLCRPN